MKKTYLNPQIEIIEIKTVGMLAQSGGVETGSTPGNEYNSSDPDPARMGIFDDEE